MRALACVRLILCASVLLLAVPATADAGLGDRTLRRGMHGGDVKILQRTLTTLGYRTRADGGFGASTERNVRRYEASERLKVDGVVSRRQGRAMRRAATGRRQVRAKEPAQTFAFGDRTLRRGDRGPDVRTLQSILTKLGFSTRVDGSFGAGTDVNVRGYERRERLRVDGVVPPSQAREMVQRAAQAPSEVAIGD